MPDRRRILLHPGFHKTGTSSAQHFLWTNRDRIAEHAHMFLLRHLQPVTSIAHSYSKTGNPLVLIDMISALDEVFRDVPDDTRDILISCEALCGHLPGWPHVDTYAAAPAILSYVAGFLVDRFACDDLRTVVTTRDRVSWLFSAYRHHLRGQRMTLDHMEFMRKYGAAADFAPILDTLRSELRGTLTTLPLEEAMNHPQGPGGALLHAFGWPEPLDDYEPVGRGNAGPDDGLWQEFLRLNRTNKPDADVTDRKEKLAKQAQLGGWRKQ